MNRKLFKHKDNAEGQLNAGISASTLTIPLQSGQGALFPSTLTGSATSGGTTTALNSTGIQAALSGASLGVGDIIENVTDGSYAIIKSISTNAIVTTRLKGGSDNTWQNSDVWAINRFLITLVKYDTDGETVLQREKVLIESRSGDNLTVNASGRGFDGSTAASFATGDYVYLFMTSSAIDGIQQAIAQAFVDVDSTLDTLATAAFVGVSNVWTSVQSFTADLLQITTDPNSGNDPVRSSYLDSTLATLQASLIATLAANAVYGDGSDGAITFDGSTAYPAFSNLSGGVYTLTRNVYGTTIVLSGTAIVDCANAEVYATVSITRTGTAKFRNNGNAASGGTGAVAKAGITLPGQPAGGNGGGGSNNNSQGGAGNAGTAVTFGLVGAGAGGGAGGPGSGGGPGAGGGGGAAPATKRLPRTIDLATRFYDYITGTLQLIQTSSGSGGGGGGWGSGTNGSTGGSGGGGGGPAGIVKVSTPTITDSGTGTMFEAIGGAGGNGTAASGGSAASGGGGGGGGNGGVIIRIRHTQTGSCTTAVTGGAAGTGGAGASGGNAGVTGTAGSAGAVYNITV